MKACIAIFILFVSLHSVFASPSEPSISEADFWWGNVSGTNYLTIQRNSNSPHYCPSSWAFSSTSALSDRIKIIRKAQWPDIILSPQVLISCCETTNGCHGGSLVEAYLWIKNNNITDSTCSPYQALDTQAGLGCSSKLKCINCEYNPKECDPQLRGKIYGIDEIGSVEGEKQMMQEIKSRGPITCSIPATKSFLDYEGGILEDAGGQVFGVHHVSITGWGEENGVKYWRVRNTWGSYWGEGGDMRILRGKNTFNIEASCTWATPIDTWTKDIRNETKPKEEEYLRPALSINRNRCKRESTKLVPESVKTARPHQYLNLKDLPQNWDWRNVSRVNYLSWTKNQWAPHNCGDCWVEATTSALADRINIARNRTWPDLTLAPQVIINCNYGGNCEGGNPGHVYKYAMEFGLPEESCQNFQAKNPPTSSCSHEQICHRCTSTGCVEVEKYAVWKATEHGLVEGAERMKAEIFARGPISCGIEATDKWQAYAGGIYSQAKLVLTENHEISVVGWGTENEVEYWIGRNSYGTHWGEDGFFRIRMHRNNLGIERECSWAAVDKEPHTVHLKGKTSHPEEQ